MTITENTLETSIFNEVRTRVVSAGLAVTTQTTGIVTSASIEATYNDTAAVRPMVIIHPVNLDRQNNKFGSTNINSMINVIIDCYAKDTLGVDQLGQGLRTALEVNDIAGIDLVNVSSDYAFNSPGDNKYHLKSYVFTYQRE